MFHITLHYCGQNVCLSVLFRNSFTDGFFRKFVVKSHRTLDVSLHYLVKKKQVAAKRLLRTRTTFSQYVMVSVGVSKLGITDLIFIDQSNGAKVNGAYYCDVLLSQQLLPMMLACQPSSSSFNKTALLHTGHVTLCDFSS